MNAAHEARSAAVSAWPLTQLNQEAAEQLDLIATRLAQGEFELAQGGWRFALTPVPQPTPWPAEAVVLSMEWGGAAFHLVASPAVWSLLYAHQFPQLELAVLPEDLALAAFELAWQDLVTRLENLSGRRVKLLGVHRQAMPEAVRTAPWCWQVALDSATAGDGVQALLLTEDAGLAMLALLARRQAPRVRAVAPEQIMRLRLEVGQCALPLAQLRALAVHDVVMLDDVQQFDAPRVLLRADARHGVWVRVRDGRLHIESALEKITMSDAGTPPVSGEATAGAPVALDSLEVRLSFDLGDQSVTLGELAAMQPGQVLSLDAALPRLVAIRANGQLIGRGELVQVDQLAGVRVLELATPESNA